MLQWPITRFAELNALAAVAAFIAELSKRKHTHTNKSAFIINPMKSNYLLFYTF